MWCNWKGVPSNWAGPLLRWWPLGRSMPCQVFTVFATLIFYLGFHPSLSMWSRILHDSPVHSTFLCYLFSWDLVWMQENFSFHLRVHFKVKFIAAPHPLPPRAFFPNSKTCQAFSEFISKTILDQVANGSLSVWGKWGKRHLPTWLCPSPLNLQYPTCAMMRDFSTCGSKNFPSPWILLLTSPVTSLTIVSKLCEMTKVGMTMSVFRQTVGRTSVLSGMDGSLFLILSPSDGRLARTFIILSVWSPLATFVFVASHVLNI